MSSVRIVIPGKPRPKTRPQVRKNGHVYTASAPWEEEAATYMLQYSGCFKGRVATAFFFYGAHPSSDPDNLVKLYLDALVRARVIPSDRGKFVRSGYWEWHDNDGDPRTVVVVGDA